MTPPLILSTLWLLCMLVAVMLVAPRRDVAREGLLTLAGTFGVGAALALWIPPRSEVVGVLVAAAAAWAALGPAPLRFASVLAGALAALATGLYVGNGAPAWLAVGLPGGFLALAALCACSWSSVRAPAMREGFAVLAAAALVTTAAPGVLNGWRSAQALNRPVEIDVHAVPMWTLLFLAVAIAAGLLRGSRVWR